MHTMSIDEYMRHHAAKTHEGKMAAVITREPGQTQTYRIDGVLVLLPRGRIELVERGYHPPIEGCMPYGAC